MSKSKKVTSSAKNQKKILNNLKKTFLGFPDSLEKKLVKTPTQRQRWHSFGRVLSLPFRNKLVGYGLLAVFFSGLAVFAFLIRDLPSPRRLTSQENFAV